MNIPPISTTTILSAALQKIPNQKMEEERISRRLLSCEDPFEKMVFGKFFSQSIAKYLCKIPTVNNLQVLLLDFAGGGEGGKLSKLLITSIGKHGLKPGFTHVAFATPTRGLGTLLRSGLTSAGVESGVMVDVISHMRPAKDLPLTTSELEIIRSTFHSIIVIAPEGNGGLIPTGELFSKSIARLADLFILSYPDPEFMVADIETYQNFIANETRIDAIRFWVQATDSDGAGTEIGRCTLGGEINDASDRLWVLLDNAKRHPYKILVEPMNKGIPCGIPFLAPCKTFIENQLIEKTTISKILTAGNRTLVALETQLG